VKPISNSGWEARREVSSDRKAERQGGGLVRREEMGRSARARMPILSGVEELSEARKEV
jgi:hypothetical protein